MDKVRTTMETEIEQFIDECVEYIGLWIGGMTSSEHI
jgi:hypothetical protein